MGERRAHIDLQQDLIPSTVRASEVIMATLGFSIHISFHAGVMHDLHAISRNPCLYIL
jgi:hypothetical protein